MGLKGSQAMLASPPVRAAGERVGGLWAAFGAAAICLCAVFFGGGLADVNAPLVWIGAPALLLAALLAGFVPFRFDRPAAIFLGCIFVLAVLAGLTTIWSISADRSWTFTNRTLLYAAVALVCVVVGRLVATARLERRARPPDGGARASGVLAKVVAT